LEHEKSPATAPVARPRRLGSAPAPAHHLPTTLAPSSADSFCFAFSVLIWQEFEQAAPEIAANGRELIERFQFVLVGTLTKDGSPRVTPVEAYIVDGHLLVNMIPRSLKARDLLRDPRIYVHAPVTSKEGSPEFKLAGRAEVLDSRELRSKLDDLFWEMIKWRPAADSHYFDLLAERAAWVSYDGDGQTSIRWRVDGEGEKRLYKPGI
jgi:predicted pyridoxine 5'-phosphate oxidase superfamily flavin-nucleotide-binding protein